MPTPPDRRAILVTDLGYGDAGKGTLVDFLARQHGAHTVVRFNGGAQAAHNVVTPDGRWHTFSQFGAATFVPGVRSYFSRHTLIDPLALENEAAHLIALGVTDCYARLSIDRDALVITPYQQAANRLKELARGANRHGSCGMGIGETAADALAMPESALRMGDLADGAVARRKLAAIREAKRAQLGPILTELPDMPEARASLALFERDFSADLLADYRDITRRFRIADESDLAALLRAPGPVLFEGAQGVLLDQDVGFPPYNTWSNTTFANALNLLGEAAYQGDVHRLGVLRTYFTRHGAGPFVTEAPELSPLLPERHNGLSAWQGGFRVGWFDAVAARYAMQACGGIDSLALTHMDRLANLPAWQWCDAYTLDGQPYALTPPLAGDQDAQAAVTRDLFRVTPEYQAAPPNGDSVIAAIESALGTRISLTSHGISAGDKVMRAGTG
ncbi:MAG: adenylosuccinate synthetase [Pleurocapsa minor GSE-CHR-MK-17-07R]|jgi:adenylosuccinate synthase|nr:adenylosuccinate synthetase [Pleurocapsa minor GSE-CHR-MK 17-07R]